MEQPTRPTHVFIDGVLHKLVSVSDYNKMQTDRIKLQLEYNTHQQDIRDNIDLCRVITGDDKSPYFGKATETMRWDNVQDPVEYADTYLKPYTIVQED